jgi:tetratricopeptide (TPR) repeat protein
MPSARLATLAALTVATAAVAADNVKEQAVSLYDRGRYEDARKTLEELDRAHALDGPLLYRLYFCEKAAGRTDDARKALDRARAALESEVGSSASLEVAFYLANTYSNLGLSADARNAAKAMTDKIESKHAPAPTSAIGLFQVGKLYEDQSRQKEALTYYAKAVDKFDLADRRYAGNAAWALRYLGNAAFASADFQASERALARRTELDGVEAADWNTLAAARVRLGKYALAAEAWKASVRLDPAGADDPRYSARLADTAAVLAPLPTTADGAAFTAMDENRLKSVLKAQAEALAAAQTHAAEAMGPKQDGGPAQRLDPKLRAEAARTLRETRGRFVAAGLEYAVRGYGIRETAFGNGYAVLIFQDSAWELPQDPKEGS